VLKDFADSYFQIIKILEIAGNVAMENFQKKVKVTSKNDDSPVSEVDFKINDLLCEFLRKNYPYKIISEENGNDDIDLEIENELWVIDPLDGTAAYLQGIPEFAICLAKVKNNRPEFGFIHVPTTKETFFSDGQNAYVKLGEEVSEIKAKSNSNKIIASFRMKKSTEFQEFIEEKPEHKIIYFSSAIKYCKIANGEFEIFPNFGNVKDWDAVAGDAIIHAAGGKIENLKGEKLKYCYDKKFTQQYFIATTS
jgi:3'(2'), 5'-bisphosphate nucleotidase